MNRRVITIITLLCACAYGCVCVLNNDVPSFAQDWFEFSLLWLSPWVLFLASIKSWHRCYTWRLMLDRRNIEPILPRGGLSQNRKISQPHILEYICCGFFILSCASLLKLFGVSHIVWIMGAVFFSIFLLCKAIGRI